MEMDPAATIIDKCGGPEVVSKITGRHISNVYRWATPKDQGGTGGIIPTVPARLILAFAKRERLNITGLDFFELPRPANASERASTSQNVGAI